MRWIGAHNLVVVFSLAILIGAGIYSVVAPVPATPALSAIVGKTAEIEGVVVKDPDVREKTVLLTLAVEKVNSAVAGGTILVSVDQFAHATYGDTIVATGKLEVPKSFETDAGRTFDYRSYLRAQGVTHVLPFAKVEVVAHGGGSDIVATLLSIKNLLERGIQTALPEPESALATGLLLGDKQSLGDSITESFRRAGVVHIIVLSGYNVSVVIGAVLFVALYFLSKRSAFIIAGLFVIGFVIMTGASETTIRAGAMALIALFAKVLNRPADGVRILLMVAAGMALVNPFLVLYDLSYQLSILATLGLVLFSDPLQKKMRFIPEAGGLREIVATTLATQFTVLPLLILSIGQVSLVFLFTNVLILPAVSIAMLASFVSALLALASYALAFPAIAIAYAVLHYIIAVSVWFGTLPYAAISVPQNLLPILLSLLALIYASIFFYFAYKRKAIV